MEEKSEKNLTVDSENDYWDMWSMQHLATATMLDIDEIYTEDFDLTQMNSDQLKSQTKNIKKAYGMLVIACKDKVSFGLVKYSKSRDFPCGDAKLTWSKLENKFDPDDAQTLIELKEDFMNCKLNDIDENTDEWITTLNNFRVRLEDTGHKIEDVDFLLHIVVNLPASYDTVVEIVQDGLKDGSLSLDTVQTKLKAKFKRLQKMTDIHEEKGLFHADKSDSMKCKYCGRKVHASED